LTSPRRCVYDARHGAHRQSGSRTAAARAIASDLTLYHEKEIVEGIENDSLFQ